MDEFYLLTSSIDFGFSESDPTESKLCLPDFISKREKLVNTVLDKILGALNITVEEPRLIILCVRITYLYF